jgi:translation elongation factor EF-Tu-like GTPase
VEDIMDIMEAVIMVVEDIMEVEGAGLLVMGAAEDGEGETAVGEVVELDWRRGGKGV